MTRDITAAAAAEDFNVLVRLLSPTWTGPAEYDQSAQMCLAVLPQGRENFQESALVKIYVELLRFGKLARGEIFGTRRTPEES